MHLFFFSKLSFSLGPRFICLNGQAAPEGEMHQREKRRGRMCNNKWGWGHQLGGGKEAREAFMYDGWEVERVANCQVFPLSLLFVFDTQSQGRLVCGRAKERRWRATIEWNGKGEEGGEKEKMLSQKDLAECFRHLCSSLMRPRGTLCRWIEMKHSPNLGSLSIHPCGVFIILPFSFSTLFQNLNTFSYFLPPTPPPPPRPISCLKKRECHWSPLQTCWLIRRWIEM